MPCVYGFFLKLTKECVYIGSAKNFWLRFRNHISSLYSTKDDANSLLYRKLKEIGGFDNIYHMILYTTEENIDIRLKEKEYYEIYKPCWNTNRPLTTNLERKEDQKKVNQKRNIPKVCECGGKYRLRAKHKHIATLKHQKWLSENL